MHIIPQTFRCAIGKHEPSRHKVVWDGMHYIGNCQACGVEIYLMAGKRWRLLAEPV